MYSAKAFQNRTSDVKTFLPLEGAGDIVYNREAATLDKHFRLLREDMLGSMKSELQDELQRKPGESVRLFRNPRISGIDFKPEPHFVLKVEMTPRLISRVERMKADEVTDFFENGPGRKIFGQDSLVVMLECADDSKRDTAKFSTIAVGIVVARRNIVSKQDNQPGQCPFLLQVGISFAGSSVKTIVPCLQGLKFKKNGFRLGHVVFNASTSFFTYEPVLRTLQEMDKIPLSDVLVHLHGAPRPNLCHAGKKLEDFSSGVQAAVRTDATQSKALQLIFDSQVVLVQGPPGTGKTYIGVQMVKAMIEANEKWKTCMIPPLQILCLCYTNHALDSFLEALLDAGISAERFIRLGTSPKISSRLRDRCIKELEQSKFDKFENRAYAGLKQQQSDLENEIKKVAESLDKSTWGKTKEWWHRIAKFLEEEYYDVYCQLRTDTSEQSGFRAVGRNNKAIEENYLWERWCEGNDRGIFRDKTKMACSHTLDIWALKKDARAAQKDEWNREWVEPLQNKIACLMEDLRRVGNSLNDLRQSCQSRVLSKATIIGCTTVSATKLRGVLRQVGPSVVLVEEAGEIFEAQILTNLSDKCKQLIMIGDHKQLPPKAECYRLRKEAGNGFNVDVSLFERLVCSAWDKDDGQQSLQRPFVTLSVQHRMRPEISRLVRETMYPHLIDHAATLNRGNVKGVTKNIVFVDHRKEEMHDEDAAALGSNSKMNLHEVEMVVGIAEHLMKQGSVNAEKIAILTPYLGQLAQIRRALSSKQVKAILNELDRGDLARMDLDDGGGAGNVQGFHAVRAATIDNFQGEEADIVIISLVRSNKDGEIGFLSSPERVNVLFSRARIGQYIVGNLDTLTNCRSSRGRVLWRQIKHLLESQGQLLDFFPVQCNRHRLVEKIREPKDFLLLAKNGGCSLPCGGLLDCGHPCPLACHADEVDVHARQNCSVLVADVCSYGHSCQRHCKGQGITCPKIVSWVCLRGHTLSGKCCNGRPMKCKTCHRLEILEKEAEAAEEKRIRELESCEKELEEARARAELYERTKNLDKRIGAMKHERELIATQLQRNEVAPLPKREKSAGKQERKKVGKASESTAVAESLVEAEINAPSPGSDKYNIDVESQSTSCSGILTNIDGLNAELQTTKDTAHELKDDIDVESESTLFSGVPKESDGLNAEQRKNKDAVLLESVFTSQTCAADMANGFKSTESECTQMPKVLQNSNPSTHQKDRQPFAAISASADDSISLDEESEDLITVMNTYKRKGPLQADSGLDSVIKEWSDAGKSKTLPNSFLAMRFILQRELDPCSPSSLQDFDVTSVQTLPQAVCCLAQFLSMHEEYPLQAKQLAEKLVRCPEQATEILCGNWLTVVRSAAQQSTFASSVRDKSFTQQLTAKEQWQAIAHTDPKAPSVMNEVMDMIGIEEVKLAMIGQYHRTRLAVDQKDGAASSYNVRFEGNPGTGKTTVARHYAAFLKQLSLLPESAIVLETSGASLIHKGVRYLEEQLDKIKKAEGAVIFIDEAYQLMTDRNGKQVLDFIIPMAESLVTEFGHLVWIFAGYTKDMEKLFEHNVGMPSRFPIRFRFEDYSDEELTAIFQLLLIKQPAQSNPLQKSKELSSKSVRIPMSQSGSVPATMSIYTANVYGSSQQLSREGNADKDQFGNTWTWNGNAWADKFGNITGSIKPPASRGAGLPG